MSRRNERFNQAREKWPPEITIKKYRDLQLLSNDDEKLIFAYVAKRAAVNPRGLSPSRRDGIIKHLCYWRRYFKVKYLDSDIEDVRSAVAEYRTSKTMDIDFSVKRSGREYKKNSQHIYIGTLKSFYYYLIAERGCTIPYQLIREIKGPGLDKNTSRPEQLLTTDDIMAMVAHETDPMRRAFIASHGEDMCRPCEHTSLTWSDVIDDPDGKILRFDSYKVNGVEQRTTFLTYAGAYLEEWRKVSPAAGPDDYIFVDKRKRNGKIEILPLTRTNARRIMIKAMEKAGIDGKQKKLYNFRKSEITRKYKTNTPVAAINKAAFGSEHSTMAQVYVKLADNEVIDALKAGSGIHVKNQNNKAIRPIECPKCHTENTPDNDLCKRCGTPISPRAIKTAIESKEYIRSLVLEELKRQKETA